MIAEYFAGGHLRFVNGEWRDDNGDAIEISRVRHGRWEQTKEWATKAKYRCSVCGREIMSAVKVNIEKYPYCHCGAKMDGGDNNIAMT